jgi:hypothetical protein
MLFVVALRGAEPTFDGGGELVRDKGADVVEALSVISLVGVPGRSCFEVDTRLGWREGGNGGACVDVADDGVAIAMGVSVRGAEATRSILAELLRATGDCNGAAGGVLADNGGKADELIEDFAASSTTLDVDFPGIEIFVNPGGRGRFSDALVADVGTAEATAVEIGVFLFAVVDIATFAGLAAFVALVFVTCLVLLLSRAGKSSGWRVEELEAMEEGCEVIFFAVPVAVADGFTSCLGFP